MSTKIKLEVGMVTGGCSSGAPISSHADNSNVDFEQLKKAEI